MLKQGFLCSAYTCVSIALMMPLAFRYGFFYCCKREGSMQANWLALEGGGPAGHKGLRYTTGADLALSLL